MKKSSFNFAYWFGMVCILMMQTMLNAQDARQNAPSPGPSEPGRGAILDRLADHLKKVDLTRKQQTRIDQILDETSQKMTELRQTTQGDLSGLREKVGELFRQTHERINHVLTADQQKKLRELMSGGENRPDAPVDQKTPKSPEKSAENQQKTTGNSPDRSGKKGDKTPDAKPDNSKPAPSSKPSDMMGETPMQEMMGPKPDPAKPDPSKPDSGKPDAGKTEAARPATPDPKIVLPSLAAQGLQPGNPAPNFNLKNLAGKSISLANQRGKPTVLLFGSFTSPTFRDKIATFDALNKDLRNKANFILIYTHEAYPNNEWDVQRNIDEQIRIAQHTTIEERTNMAKITRDGLKINMEILVDEMDDAVATAYAGIPNGCYVIDSAGTIVLRQRWADPHGVRAALTETLRAK